MKTVAGRTALRLLPRIERQEVRRVTLAALSFVCIAAGALVARAGGDALFLSHFGSGPLPLMYITGALATGLGTYACIWSSRRLKTGHIAIVVGAMLILANVTLFATFRAFPSLSRAGAYLIADVSVRIPVFLFWAFASELFDARQSRRLFGLIGSAGTAACLPAGLLVGPLARKAGAESLVLVSAALMVGFIVFATALVRDGRGQARSGRGIATGNAASARIAIRTPQLASIAALAVMTSLVETLVDFQFKTTAASVASSTDLVHIFGTLYGISSVASLLIQLLLVHRLLAVAGALASLCVLPGVLLLTQAGVFRFRSAGWVFATKALDITLTTTINGTARQLLYRGIRKESRLTARALADGLYLPLAIGLAGAGLGAMSRTISIQSAAAAGALGCVIWLLLARRAHTAYVSGLIDALKARQFGSLEDETLFSRNPTLEEWLRDAFGSASDEDLIYLATVLPQLGRLVGPVQLKAALARENPKVKIAILQWLGAGRVKEGPALARPLATHEDPDVRRAAILAATDPAASLANLDWLASALADSDPGARAAAAAGFANANDKEARELGRAHLTGLVYSDQAEFRAAAAEVLDHVHEGALDREARTQLLVRLLEDRDVPVVLAALETIRSRADTALALPVLSLLAQPVLRGAATEALVAMGPGVIDRVLSLFENGPARRNDEVLAHVSHVLARIGDPRGLTVITRMMKPRVPEQRTAVFRAYVQLLAKEGSIETRGEEIDALVAEECMAAGTRLWCMHRLGNGPAVRLARDAVSDVIACHIENAFILLDGRVPDVDLMVLHRQVTRGTGEERSNALELLENVLPHRSRDLLLGVLEPATDDGAGEPEAEVHELLADHDSEWIVAGAAWAAAQLTLVSCADQLEKLKEHESPVVRETVLFAREQLGFAR